MVPSSAPVPIEAVEDASRASRLLLHPLRVKVLEGAREPISATELGRRLGEPRQKVNYHVRELERAGFLLPAGRARRGNLEERRVVASARAYVLLPEVLGPVAADPQAAGDAASAGRLLALTVRAQSELGRTWSDARAKGTRVPSLSMEAEVRLADPERRVAFADALRRAVTEVLAQFADGQDDGAPYRMIVGVYPVPAS